MEEKKLVSRRRFRGFEDDWIGSKLGEILEITMGHSPKSSSYTNNPSDHILVQGNADIRKNRVIPRVWTTQVTKKANKNDLIMTVRAPVGEVGKTEYDVVLGRGVAGLKGNEFIFQYLIKMKMEGYWTKLSTGSTFDSVNTNDIKEVALTLPNDKEQQKIGEFFKVLDERIANQERKIAKVKALKSAYLTEMFPREGETVPKRRFKDFEGYWATSLLKDISDVRDGTHESPKYYSEGYPFITSKNVSDGYINHESIQYISEEDFNQINKRSKVDINDILMGMIGTVGNIAIIKEEPNFAIKNVALIKDIKRVNQKYLYYFFQSNYLNKQLDDGLAGGTQRFISLYKIRNLTIFVPNKEEQQKIGSFFKNLDAQIATEESKLEKLKKMKEAYLEEMFV